VLRERHKRERTKKYSRRRYHIRKDCRHCSWFQGVVVRGLDRMRQKLAVALLPGEPRPCAPGSDLEPQDAGGAARVARERAARLQHRQGGLAPERQQASGKSVRILTRKTDRLWTRKLGGQDLGGSREVAWNYVEYEVRYESLADELKIGDHYVRLLLEQGTPVDNFVERTAHWRGNGDGLNCTLR